jgi:hypothetical protein
MRVLVACEFSGIVRRAFKAMGHEAWSCDLQPSEDRSDFHMQCDVRDVLHDGWDLLMVAHPPCTRLCNSGVRWLAERNLWADLDAAADLFSACWNAPIDRIGVENPIMHKHAKARIRNYRERAQILQPWQFVHGETKATCLWLRNLPPLQPTQIVAGRAPRVHRMSPGPNRSRERSRTYPGIAQAMAQQWGDVETLRRVA